MTERDLLQTFEAALAAHVETRYAGTSESEGTSSSLRALASRGQVDAAVRYVLGNGGKRVRPVLCMLSASACGADIRKAVPAAIALEMIHTYSLVHDDLPCMDNDDLRRGKPTAHKVFGDAVALLAGDALLTDAFEVLSTAPYSANIAVALVRELSIAAGSAGMVLGQALDLHWTAREGATQVDLDAIHLHKTGYLLGSAAAMGALAAGAGIDEVARFRDFGRLVGLAFQIKDDLLDDDAGTGKSQGKDKTSGKLTYLARMSRSEAEAAAERVTRNAIARIEEKRLATPELMRFVESLLNRRS